MSLKFNFWVDLTVFTGFLIALEPRVTGTAVHEWFTLALAATLIVHFLIHWDWYVNLTKRIFQDATAIARLNYLLATLIFLGFVSIITTGLMISQVVLPFFGTARPEGFGWRGLHETSVNLTMILVALHIGLHWDWVKNTFGRVFGKKAIATQEAAGEGK